ncbi:aspartate aminotransferase family protein [Alloyangia pacifica]|uniref:aspartate aminotransferase family protein n=1 Tax=Alloyangia pacifica TaxID=311180 RepID=UPI001CD7AE0B|nr:aspartate aminotransferase family protein [Alloyangia pacifica]MCA0995052.1 aspartate aminotransferase family protein [Alloyangia pacifica]
MTDLATRRARTLGPAYRHFYDAPLYPVRGRGVELWDAEGRRYLDAYNNVPSVGHCHPRVTEALARQAEILNTHTRYMHDTVVTYGERLTGLFDPALSQVMFTCTGSEANDLALRLVRAVTGRSGIIVTSNAYHGVTLALAEMSPSLGAHNPLGAHVRTVAPPSGAGGGTRFAADVRAAIASLEEAGLQAGALLFDTAFVSDGLRLDPPGCIAGAVAEIRAAGGLWIADEVQAGLGRIGSHMWAYERHGVRPDIVTLGKPLGAGHPIAAMVTRPDLLAEFGKKTRYFNTFGGNPVSAAVGLAVLDVIEDEALMQNAAQTGARLLSGLRDLAARHPEAVADVRGTGLYAALELRGTPEAAGQGITWLTNEMRRRGILLGSCGAHGEALKIRPPLPFSPQNVEELVAALDAALSDDALLQTLGKSAQNV